MVLARHLGVDVDRLRESEVWEENRHDGGGYAECEGNGDGGRLGGGGGSCEAPPAPKIDSEDETFDLSSPFPSSSSEESFSASDPNLSSWLNTSSKLISFSFSDPSASKDSVSELEIDDDGGGGVTSLSSLIISSTFRSRAWGGVRLGWERAWPWLWGWCRSREMERVSWS
jgi:hypothetical protein